LTREVRSFDVRAQDRRGELSAWLCGQGEA